LHVLALAGVPLSLLVGGLAGVWLGFRIATRDAALLARFAVDAREARATAEATQADGKQLREEWNTAWEQIERKRASAAASATRAERATAQREAALVPAIDPESLSPRDRRRLIARRANGRA
jgi:hypothetical protein